MPTPPSPSARPIIVDTDGGVDDAAALWYLLRQPTVAVVGITIVWGNVDLEIAFASVARVLEAAGRPDIPVALGRDGPIAPAPSLEAATFIHGTDGLGNTHRPPPRMRPTDTPATELIASTIDQYPDEVTLLTLGPLSTIGDFVATAPDATERIDRVVVMGGVASGHGNARPLGEANIAHDPAAAAAVVAAPWRNPGTLVGLDVTGAATLTAAEFALLAERRTDAAAFLDEPLQFYRTFGSTFSPPGECPNHDLLAAMVVADESIVSTELLPVEVDCAGGPAWGATVVDLRQPHFDRAGGGSAQGTAASARWQVALDVDVSRFRQNVGQLFGAAHTPPRPTEESLA